MLERYLGRRSGGRARAALVAVAVPLLLSTWASSALATGKPTGVYKNMTLCPLKNVKDKKCLYSETISGEVVLNKQRVPVEKPIVLQGGVYFNETTKEDVFVNAEGGETLAKSPQAVPGGLLGILPPEFLPEPLKKLFEEYIINKGPTGVYANTELVGEVKINESNLVNLEGPTLTLPIRVHLENSFLGKECYVGSKAHPLTWELGDGVEPGKFGEIEFKESFNYELLTENTLVDKTFTAPGASGCVNYIPLIGFLTEIIADEVIDGKIGLPSESGKNKAVLNNTIEKGQAAAVKASE